jgi:hypothetical protein
MKGLPVAKTYCVNEVLTSLKELHDHVIYVEGILTCTKRTKFLAHFPAGEQASADRTLWIEWDHRALDQTPLMLERFHRHRVLVHGLLLRGITGDWPGSILVRQITEHEPRS